MDIASLNILVGWIAMLFGAVSGAALGLFFDRDGWAGGYGSFRRRMLRLGHISFFGIGFLNLLFGLTLTAVSLPPTHSRIASAGFVVAVIAMPACCFLTAWKKQLRHLFPIPVLAVLAGIIPLLLGWPYE
ncbi:MAG: hypothetical protein OEV10_02590 [Gammaproteobacteria bacterium]|jgi:hypothetical protein|nr:hypothetical protein [Gammaproteobacteria bacterium]MDH3846407.1 hypothetical protein [Gammaproteobacteria bacterium]MDH3862834.1 hypothetical protein [Gammaproteobacteria bacterium]MDH3904413.1 hypothetical protein [Gammaproteobacteria bacterium]MDH3907661.1 hypothetical protein [Gammaproteobacteria bacterium]